MQRRLTCETLRSEHSHSNHHLDTHPGLRDTTGWDTDDSSDSSYSSSDADERGTVVAHDELARQAARIAYLERLFILLVSGRVVNQTREGGAGVSDNEVEDFYDTPAPAQKSNRMAIDHIPCVDSLYQSEP